MQVVHYIYIILSVEQTELFLFKYANWGAVVFLGSSSVTNNQQYRNLVREDVVFSILLVIAVEVKTSSQLLFIPSQLLFIPLIGI